MTSIDRSFIKAFADAAPRDAFHSRRAEIVQPRATSAHSASNKRESARPSTLATEADLEMAEPARFPPSAPLAPLSAFAAPPKIHEPFRAELEVDRLSWPPACEKLAQASRGWNRFVDRLIERGGQGQKCIAIVSAHRGEGRTTVCLSTAKQLAARGLRPVIVDADFENPNLACSCDLAAYTGWGEVLQADLPLGEGLVASIDDGITMMPWRGTGVSIGEVAGWLRTATSFGMLRDHFDFVLVDTLPLVGPTAISDFAAFAKSIRLDLVYVIQDVRRTHSEEMAGICAKLRRAGLQVEGIIENFLAPAGRESMAPENSQSAANRSLAHTS
jgi:Mrp family chromosome partitioning ATPase